jgi:hypothetical protein
MFRLLLRVGVVGAAAVTAACSTTPQSPHRANWNGPPETCSAYAKASDAYRACLERDEAARSPKSKFTPTA